MSDTEPVKLRFLISHPRRRDPMLVYRVESGGVDAAFSAKGQLGSWSLEFEDTVSELHARIHDRIGGAEGYESKTEICTATFPDGYGNPDAEPDIEWLIDTDQLEEN